MKIYQIQISYGKNVFFQETEIFHKISNSTIFMTWKEFCKNGMAAMDKFVS